MTWHLDCKGHNQSLPHLHPHTGNICGSYLKKIQKLDKNDANQIL